MQHDIPIRIVRFELTMSTEEWQYEKLTQIGRNIVDNGTKDNESGYIERTVDIVLAGSSFLATRAALREMRKLIEVHGCDIDIKTATRIHSPPNKMVYKIYRERSDTRFGPLEGMLVRFGWRNSETSVTLQDGETIPERERKLEEQNPGEGLRLRPHALWQDDTSHFSDPRKRAIANAGSIATVASMALCANFIFGLIELGYTRQNELYSVVFCVLSVAAVVIMARSLTTHELGNKRTILGAIAYLFLATVFAVVSVKLGSFLSLLVTCACPVFYYGLRVLFAGASLSQALSWVLPLIFTVALSGLPGLNGVLHDAYLRQFDVHEGSAAVPVTDFWKTWPPWDFVLEGWVALGVAMSLIGYAKYLHTPKATLRFFSLVLLGIAVGFSFLRILTGVAEAVEEGERHQIEFSKDRNPSPYLGLKYEWVRVSALTDKPSYEGCKPGARDTFISFGTTRDRITLWNPKDAESCTVRLEDYGIHRIDSEK